MALPILALVTAFFDARPDFCFAKHAKRFPASTRICRKISRACRVVQLSDRQQHNLHRYTEINEKNRLFEHRLAQVETLYGAFNESLAQIAIGLILYYGASHLMEVTMTVGEVVLFTQFVTMLFHPIVVLGEQTNILFRAMASGERIFRGSDWDEIIHEPASPVALPERLRGDVEFRNVSFAYDSTMRIKGRIVFIHPGEKLAIVGPTGSGKSTLIRLLSRFTISTTIKFSSTALT